MKIKLVTGLLLAAISLPASTATVRMMGAGNITCKEWTELRASTEYFSAGNWILGFLSSTAWNTGDNILAGKKADKLFGAVDEFCSKEKGQSIADAAVALTSQMLEHSNR